MSEICRCVNAVHVLSCPVEVMGVEAVDWVIEESARAAIERGSGQDEDGFDEFCWEVSDVKSAN